MVLDGALVRCMRCNYIWDGEERLKCPKCGCKERDVVFVAVYPDGRAEMVDLTKPIGQQKIESAVSKINRNW